jgi:membrane protein YdbS with pleckstrin-like domain
MMMEEHQKEEHQHPATGFVTGSEKRIDENAIWVWRLNSFFALPVYLIPFYFVAYRWWSLEHPFIMLLLAAIIVSVALFLFAWVRPALRWKHWFYQIDKDYIILKYGIFFKREVVIPFSRVQLVDTSHGPIMRGYNLMDVSISTAGGVHSIPALLNEEAEELRNFIAEQAHLHDVDV